MSIFKQYMLSLRSLMILVEQKGGGIAEKKYITWIVGIYNITSSVFLKMYIVQKTAIVKLRAVLSIGRSVLNLCIY